MSVVDQVKSARRVSVPILAINTPDQVATVGRIVDGVNGQVPKVQWDFIRGLRPLSDEGAAAIAALGGDADETIANPAGAVRAGCGLPERSLLFVHNAQRYLDDAGFLQAVCNVRDSFKGNHRTLVLLGPTVNLPIELAGDVITLDEPLPNSAEIEQIIRDVHQSAGIQPDDETIARAVSATTGLPAFQVEQVTAMSLTPDGLVLADLWERKRQQIEMTPGLSVYRDGETFDDIGGVQTVKDFLHRICTGNNPPHAIVKIDEIDKMLAGEGDLSGVSQDQLGTLLAYMEDHRCRGLLFVGPPGCSKSLLSKAAGNEAGIPTIELDLGATKGSLVGQSEQQLRDALKVITSVSNDRSLWIATANRIDNLNTALLRRFPKTFYFDLPDEEEKAKIWKIHGGQLAEDKPDDDMWAGADIRNCCEDARDLNCPLSMAAQWVVPVGVRSRGEIDALRKQANGRFLSASKPGVFTLDDATTARRISLDD